LALSVESVGRKVARKPSLEEPTHAVGGPSGHDAPSANPQTQCQCRNPSRSGTPDPARSVAVYIGGRGLKCRLSLFGCRARSSNLWCCCIFSAMPGRWAWVSQPPAVRALAPGRSQAPQRRVRRIGGHVIAGHCLRQGQAGRQASRAGSGRVRIMWPFTGNPTTDFSSWTPNRHDL